MRSIIYMYIVEATVHAWTHSLSHYSHLPIVSFPRLALLIGRFLILPDCDALLALLLLDLGRGAWRVRTEAILF